MSYTRIPSNLLFALLVVGMTSALGQANKSPWRTIEPAHFALKAPAVEKDADAEVLFWEVRVQPQGQGASLSHYLRIKIFTERGRESQAKVEFLHPEGDRVTEIAGRTVKADGTVLELSQGAVFERDVAHAREFNIKSTSFVLPGVEPGAVIEYRWREERKSPLTSLQFQRETPIQNVKHLGINSAVKCSGYENTHEIC
jgi:hypothetical protein